MPAVSGAPDTPSQPTTREGRVTGRSAVGTIARRVYHHAGIVASTRTATITASAPSSITGPSTKNPEVGIGVARDTDGRERRHRDREHHREQRGGDRDDDARAAAPP